MTVTANQLYPIAINAAAEARNRVKNWAFEWVQKNQENIDNRLVTMANNGRKGITVEAPWGSDIPPFDIRGEALERIKEALCNVYEKRGFVVKHSDKFLPYIDIYLPTPKAPWYKRIFCK